MGKSDDGVDNGLILVKVKSPQSSSNTQGDSRRREGNVFLDKKTHGEKNKEIRQLGV